MDSLTAWVPSGFPNLRGKADLETLIVQTLRTNALVPQDGDVLVVAQKVVSKAEGNLVDLREVRPTDKAKRLAVQSAKDPRLVQVIINESRAISRVRPGLIIAEHRLGFICANAGVDHSNVGLGEDWVCLLPKDPDASSGRIHEALREAFGAQVAVIINDTHGRPFREGAVGVAIGVGGLEPMFSYIGQEDLYGYVLRVSIEAVADELAATASLLQGQGAEGTPLVLIRGARFHRGEGTVGQLLRAAQQDLFR
jgi:coenzyme F420-0:L-glutamate ligase/coenzyme F420-1:gamma-L-glutamate ligase